MSIVEVRYVYVGTTGALTPMTILVPAEDSTIDLSTVTGATIDVQKPDDTLVTWTAATAVYDPTAKLLTITYPFVSGDIDQIGAYVAYANLSVPGGTKETHRRTFTGRARMDPTP